MVGAFVYLALCSIRNRIRARLRRLREPRYLIGLAVGVAYLALVTARYSAGFEPSRARQPALADVPASADYRGLVGAIGAAGLFVIAALAWVLPGTGRPPLAFSRAEVQWLFTAPISRRQLLHYKILRSLAGAALGSALVTLVFRPGRAGAGWPFFVGTVVLMMTVNLHVTGVSLRRQSLKAHGRSGWARQWVPLTVVAAATLALVGTLAAHWPALTAVTDPGGLFVEILRTATAWPARLVLLPFSVLVGLPLSTGSAEFLGLLPVAAGLLAVNYVWVLRSDAAFEEAAARDAAARAAPGRAGVLAPPPTRRAPPFQLGPSGRPEVALLWKNLILAGRYATWGVFWRVLPFLLLLSFVVAQAARSLADALAVISALGAVGAVLLGPQILRNDLRQDLTQIATLKTWPLDGATIVRGEVLAPTVMLTTIVWGLAAIAVMASTRVTFDTELSVAARVSYGSAAALLAPGVILVQIVAQNGLALMFPAWIELGSLRTRGMDVMGQRLLVAGALFTTVAVALVPATIVAVLLSWGLAFVTGTAGVLLPAAAAALVLLAEGAAVVQVLGRVMDRTDATAVPVEE